MTLDIISIDELGDSSIILEEKIVVSFNDGGGGGGGGGGGMSVGEGEIDGVMDEIITSELRPGVISTETEKLGDIVMESIRDEVG